jgi:hypothetical protein
MAVLGFSLVFCLAFGRGGLSTRAFWEDSQTMRTHDSHYTSITIILPFIEI